MLKTTLRNPTLSAAAALVLLMSLATPALADDTEGPTIMQYGWSGLSTGLGIGFAAGYLAIGDTYQDGEWRAMAYGAGIGGLSGIGVGLVLGLVDVGAAPKRPAYIVLRDVGYGASLGAVSGLIVGTLVAIGEKGQLRDVVTGSAYGTIIGAGAGLLFGVVEAIIRGSSDSSQADAGSSAHASSDSLHFTVIGAQDAARKTVLMPAVYGSF